MQPYGKDSVVSGQLVDWGVMYEKFSKTFTRAPGKMMISGG
jgi:hypothetical protein